MHPPIDRAPRVYATLAAFVVAAALPMACSTGPLAKAEAEARTIPSQEEREAAPRVAEQRPDPESREEFTAVFSDGALELDPRKCEI